MSQVSEAENDKLIDELRWEYRDEIARDGDIAVELYQCHACGLLFFELKVIKEGGQWYTYHGSPDYIGPEYKVCPECEGDIREVTVYIYADEYEF